MYTPTKEELEEIGFISEGIHSYFSWEYEIFKLWPLQYKYMDKFSIECYDLNIESIEDIKTLIRILTPQ